MKIIEHQEWRERRREEENLKNKKVRTKKFDRTI